MVLEYIKKYKEEVKRCIEDLKHKETFYKQVPNLLTFSRAVGGLPIGIMFLNGNIVMGIISTVLLLSTDLFDGRIARKWNIQSKFGADLDAFCDKIMFLGLSLPLIVNNPIVLFNFVLEGAISGINVFGRMKGLDTKTVFVGKVKTCFLSLMLIVGYLVQFVNLPVAVLNVLVSMTFGAQCVALSSYIKEYNRMSNEQVMNVSVLEEKVEEEIVVYEQKESLIEQLEREKQFYLGFNEPDIVRENTRTRRIEDEKKNGNLS